jgi:hypothetical protein
MPDKITFTPFRDAPNAPAEHRHEGTGVVMRRRYYRWTDRDLRFCWAVYVPGEREPRAEGDTLAQVRPAAVAAVEELLSPPAAEQAERRRYAGRIGRQLCDLLREVPVADRAGVVLAFELGMARDVRFSELVRASLVIEWRAAP